MDDIGWYEEDIDGIGWMEEDMDGIRWMEGDVDCIGWMAEEHFLIISKFHNFMKSIIMNNKC